MRPRLTANEKIKLKTTRTGVTWSDYRNGVPYDEAMDKVKSLLKNDIVVGHNIRCDERALCCNLDEIAHRVMDTATCRAVNNLSSSEKGKIQFQAVKAGLPSRGNVCRWGKPNKAKTVQPVCRVSRYPYKL